MEKKLIAIATNGSNAVSLVKSVDEQEYKKLINLQSKHLSNGEKLALEHTKQHESFDKAQKHYSKLELVLAKSVYDNFVDRGLIENDESFQQAWYDFYFNGGELPRENTPKEYQDILERLAKLWTRN